MHVSLCATHLLLLQLLMPGYGGERPGLDPENMPDMDEHGNQIGGPVRVVGCVDVTFSSK